MKHKKVILSSVVLLFITMIGLGLYVNWAFSNPVFCYGDISYWLFTDKEFRNFPIIGSGLKDVRYQSLFQDGTKPGVLKLAYDTQLSSGETLKSYQTVCQELDYTTRLTDHTANGILIYSGKGRYDQIEIIVEENSNNGSQINVNFIMKLEN